MATFENEAPLIGGRVTAGVVRVGNTVRRPRTANSDFVQRLLAHLGDKGFEGAPSYLGTDERGRDIFSFVDGDVPTELSFHEDETIRGAASLIRRYHDLTAELLAFPAVSSPGIEVICHNDLSPCNFVFRAGAPVAMIDFDSAAPGSRLHDLGYAAWLWLDLGNLKITALEQTRRLAIFTEAYGMYDHALVVAASISRQSILIADGNRTGKADMALWATECLNWTQRTMQQP